MLAFTSAAALEDALADWSSATRTAAAALAWSLWAVALLGLLAPRPWGFTTLRVATTVAVVSAALSAIEASAGRWIPALAVALIATTLVSSAAVAHACADGIAYGYERRFPLRAPFALLIGGIPLTALLIAVGAGAGVLLLAGGEVAGGIVALVVGLPVAAVLVRALHGLARRWLVIVPAGFVVADPLTLADPVLVNDDALASIDAAPARSPSGAVDLRLGTAFGSLIVTTHEAGPVSRRTARKEAATITTDRLLVSPVRPTWFESALAERSRSRQ